MSSHMTTPSHVPWRARLRVVTATLKTVATSWPAPARARDRSLTICAGSWTLTGSPTSFITMSRSWIIRSSTTSTSSARGENTLSRCTSKNIGCVISGYVARTAGLKRSR